MKKKQPRHINVAQIVACTVKKNIHKKNIGITVQDLVDDYKKYNKFPKNLNWAQQDYLRRFLTRVLQYRFMTFAANSPTFGISALSNPNFFKKNLKIYKLIIFNEDKLISDTGNIYDKIETGKQYTSEELIAIHGEPKNAGRVAMNRLYALGYLNRKKRYYTKEDPTNSPWLAQVHSVISSHIKAKARVKATIRKAIDTAKESFAKKKEDDKSNPVIACDIDVDSLLDTIKHEEINKFCAIWYVQQVLDPNLYLDASDIYYLCATRKVLSTIIVDPHTSKAVKLYMITKLLGRLQLSHYNKVVYTTIKKETGKIPTYSLYLNTEDSNKVLYNHKRIKKSPASYPKTVPVLTNTVARYPSTQQVVHTTTCSKGTPVKKPKDIQVSSSGGTTQMYYNILTKKEYDYYKTNFYSISKLDDSYSPSHPGVISAFLKDFIILPGNQELKSIYDVIRLDFDDITFTDPKWIGLNDQAYLLRLITVKSQSVYLIISSNSLPGFKK